MEKGNLKEKIERFKEKAKIFLAENLKTFIEDINGDYYFCKILKVNDNYFVVKSFAGKRNLEMDRIFFVDVVRFEEYEKLEEGK
tara:strand:- start:26 stop:277 length:252 start_codon:yes stop_codon:yes gene_type:complete